MNKSRLDALERRLRHGDAPPELVALLARLKAEQGDTTPPPPTLADTLAEIITRLPD
jgi:hypothetical protein